jgi:hypothetical protein
MVEAVRPFKLDPTSISYIYKVFEDLLLLLIGILCTFIPLHYQALHSFWRVG